MDWTNNSPSVRYNMNNIRCLIVRGAFFEGGVQYDKFEGCAKPKLMLQDYFSSISTSITDKISNIINHGTINTLTQIIFRNYIADKKFLKAHQFYLTFTGNINAIEKEQTFFRTFRSKYSLRVAESYVDRLDNNKHLILNQITVNPLCVYKTNFTNVPTNYKGRIIYKAQSSFFSKLMHTVNPDHYCALDNPIKNKIFELKTEGFFFSYCLINDVYTQWINSNLKLLTDLRNSVQQVDTANLLQMTELTNMKVLDMIFWYKANIG